HPRRPLLPQGRHRLTGPGQAREPGRVRPRHPRRLLHAARLLLRRRRPPPDVLLPEPARPHRGPEGGAERRAHHLPAPVHPPPPPSPRPPARRVPPIHEGVAVSPFDAKWDRKIRVRSGGKADLVPQHLHLLTPRFAQVNAVKHYAWASYFLTPELGPEAVQA